LKPGSSLRNFIKKKIKINRKKERKKGRKKGYKPKIWKSENMYSSVRM